MVVLKEQKNMLWALVLEAGKQYSQTVEQGFHISMAALEIPPDHEELKAKQHDVVSVMVSNDKSEFLLCTLSYKSVFQQALDLNFSEGEQLKFFVNGNGTVHLSGYEMEDETMFDSMYQDGSDEEEGEELSDDDEVPQLVAGNKRKKSTPTKQSSKKIKWVTPGGGEYSDEDSDDDSDDEDYDSDEMDDDMDASGMMEFEMDDDDSEDDDTDEEDDSEEEMTPAKPVKKENKEKTPKQNIKTMKQEKQTPKQDGKKTPKQEVTKTPKQEPKQTPKSSVKNLKAETPATPANSVGPAGDTESKKKKKKKKKSKNDGESPAPENKATPQQKNVQQQKTPKKQVLAGGTILEEIRVGDGHPVKAGKMAHVYYVGKLAKDGKQFDSCTGGKPFRFKVGKSEVIQGWDIGVAGMKVGGKRRLTVPPQQGYGGQRQGPIPPNSTLVFEVELKNVS